MQLEINEESVCFLFLPHPLPPTFPFSILNFQFSIPLSFSQHHYRPRADEARISHGLAQNDVTICVVRK